MKWKNQKLNKKYHVMRGFNTFLSEVDISCSKHQQNYDVCVGVYVYVFMYTYINTCIPYQHIETIYNVQV